MQKAPPIGGAGSAARRCLRGFNNKRSIMDNSSPKIYTEFLPISRADMEARGWEQLDFVVVGGDAYVDHPSFGTAIISRLLEAEGYKIGVLA